MIFEITETDMDYGTVTDSFNKEFKSLEEADEWCHENSWGGYTYSAKPLNGDKNV